MRSWRRSGSTKASSQPLPTIRHQADTDRTLDRIRIRSRSCMSRGVRPFAAAAASGAARRKEIGGKAPSCCLGPTAWRRGHRSFILRRVARAPPRRSRTCRDDELRQSLRNSTCRMYSRENHGSRQLECVLHAPGFTRGLPSRSPPIHDPKVRELRQTFGGRRKPCRTRPHRLRHFVVNAGQRFKQRQAGNISVPFGSHRRQSAWSAGPRRSARAP